MSSFPQFILLVRIIFILLLPFFFFNDTATTEIYTLSLHDALPICRWPRHCFSSRLRALVTGINRSEEHTSELQSQFHLVCRLLLEKKKKQKKYPKFIFKKKIKISINKNNFKK